MSDDISGTYDVAHGNLNFNLNINYVLDLHPHGCSGSKAVPRSDNHFSPFINPEKKTKKQPVYHITKHCFGIIHLKTGTALPFSSHSPL